MHTVVRRCLTVPIFLGLAACVPLLLAVLPFVGALDLSRRSDWATVRALAFFAYYVVCESLGIVAAAVLWVRYRLLPGMTCESYLRANFRLQCRWASALYRGIETVFRISTKVTGSDALEPGPILVFSRHTSTGDTIIPNVFISSQHDILLRYVLKRELLWDPCIDIVGNRLPNYFVDRQSTDSTKAIEQVAELAVGLGDREGVLIYPEGTRFSERKRARAISRLGDGDDSDLADVARSMRNVLPPKIGGAVALLQENLGADLVLLAHTGFEGVESLSSLFNGSLIGREVRIQFRRIARRDIPTDPDLLRRWLFETWKTIDEWVGQNQARPASAIG